MKSVLGRSVLVVATFALLRCGSGESIGFSGDDAGTDGSSGSSGSGATGNGGNAGSGTGGTAGQNTGGNGGTGGVGPSPTYSYLLWSNLASARIVRVSNSDGSVMDEKKLDYPEDGFAARDLDVLRDGTFRLLWTRDTGEARLWKLDASMVKTEEIQYHAAEPSAGWSTTSFAKLPDGTSRLMWFNPKVGAAIVWKLETDDTFANGPKKNYTPAADVGSWFPLSYESSPDNTMRILWAFEGTSAGLGQPTSIWHLDPLENKATAKAVDYDQAWQARGYHVAQNGQIRMLWANDSQSTGMICTFAKDAMLAPPDPNATGIGNAQCMTYGPEASWSLRAFTRQECAPGECPEPCVDDQKLAALLAPPQSLSATGFDANSPTIQPFQPRFVLWSDGAEKQRYAFVPKCGTIDTSDMDHWQMPVGTRFWKEFRRNGVHVETRMIHRFGPGPDDWIFAAYQMGSNGQGGTYVPNGVQNANGTPHDIPSAGQCMQCHGKLPERTLGFGAIQLSHALPGTTIASLSNTGKLSVPHPQSFEPPGNDTQKAALGYFHANCGNCHNDSAPFLDMHMRLKTTDTAVEQTGIYQTAIGKPTTSFNCLGIGIGTCDRIDPTDYTQSAVLMRMQNKTTPGVQMPPIGTEVVDPTGVATITAFIQSL